MIGMNEETMKTDFAPVERASGREIRKDAKLLHAYPLIEEILDAVPGVVLILNEQRQIVFATKSILDLFNLPDRDSAYGLRPGELICCSHAALNKCGCGTTSFCSQCGAVNAILAGLEGETRVEECHILHAETGLALDFQAYATPIKILHRDLVVFALKDISHEKRKEALEHTLFHGVNKAVNSMEEVLEDLSDYLLTGHESILEHLNNLAASLKEEIAHYKAVVLAENGTLSVTSESISSLELLNELTEKFNTSGVDVYLSDKSVDIQFFTDKGLLAQVMSNLLKNAIEASDSDDDVVLGCEYYGKNVSFWVTNKQTIKPDIQLQIFNNSFSTKDKGRGLGTYSAKLIAEQYLNGMVSFTSTEEQGTTFKVNLPLISHDR